MDSAVVLRIDSCDQTTDSNSSQFINPAFRDIQDEFHGTGESEVSFTQGIRDITLSLKNLLKMYEHQVEVGSTSEDVAANGVINRQANQDEEEPHEDYFSFLPVSSKFVHRSYVVRTRNLPISKKCVSI